MAVAGMSRLFGDMATAGARGFHYVVSLNRYMAAHVSYTARSNKSNSPIELAASIIEFLHFHSFPAHFSLTVSQQDTDYLCS